MRPVLKSVPTARTPERQELADAIKVLAEARASATGAGSVVERARGALVKAQMRLSTAESLLGEARERAIGALTAEDGAQPADLKDLRRAVAEARDDVDIAAEAVRRAEEAATSPAGSETTAAWRVEEAANAVLATKARVAADALLVSQEETERLKAVVTRLVGFMHRDDPDLPRLANLRDSLRFIGGYEADVRRNAALASWDQVRNKLLFDPDAPLPEIGQ